MNFYRIATATNRIGLQLANSPLVQRNNRENHQKTTRFRRENPLDRSLFSKARVARSLFRRLPRPCLPFFLRLRSASVSSRGRTETVVVALLDFVLLLLPFSFRERGGSVDAGGGMGVAGGARFSGEFSETPPNRRDVVADF